MSYIYLLSPLFLGGIPSISSFSQSISCICFMSFLDSVSQSTAIYFFNIDHSCIKSLMHLTLLILQPSTSCFAAYILSIFPLQSVYFYDVSQNAGNYCHINKFPLFLSLPSNICYLPPFYSIHNIVLKFLHLSSLL